MLPSSTVDVMRSFSSCWVNASKSFFAVGFRIELRFLGNFFFGPCLAQLLGIVIVGFPFDEIDDPLEWVRAILQRPCANRNRHGYRLPLALQCRVSGVVNACDCFRKIGPDDVHLVDENEPGNPVGVGLSPNSFRLCFNALLPIEDDNRATQERASSARPQR